MASILDLISAVLIAPGRRTGRVVIEDAGIIEAVVMRPTLRRVRGRHPPVGVHHHVIRHRVRTQPQATTSGGPGDINVEKATRQPRAPELRSTIVSCPMKGSASSS